MSFVTASVTNNIPEGERPTRTPYTNTKPCKADDTFLLLSGQNLVVHRPMIDAINNYRCVVNFSDESVVSVEIDTRHAAGELSSCYFTP